MNVSNDCIWGQKIIYYEVGVRKWENIGIGIIKKHVYTSYDKYTIKLQPFVAMPAVVLLPCY